MKLRHFTYFLLIISYRFLGMLGCGKGLYTNHGCQYDVVLMSITNHGCTCRHSIRLGLIKQLWVLSQFSISSLFVDFTQICLLNPYFCFYCYACWYTLRVISLFSNVLHFTELDLSLASKYSCSFYFLLNIFVLIH